MEENKSTPINIPYPDADTLHLRLSIGACRLTISPGGKEGWVEGSYRDPTGRLPLRVTQDGGLVRITQGQDWSDLSRILEGAPTFTLAIGDITPFAFTLEGGASENEVDLSGLPITSLSLKHGAGRNELHFKQPNPVTMERLEIGAGAGNLAAWELANSGASQVRVDGGAAAFNLDFGGDLQSDMAARISTGVSSVEVSVPKTTPAKIYTEAFLGGLRVGDGFMKKEGAFWTQGALDGGTPELLIHTNVAVGSLAIRTT